jgi:hypothetical protein
MYRTPSVLLPIASLALLLFGLSASPVQTESAVVGELADETVGGGAEGNGEDDADGEELDGDLLEGTDALGDGVGWEALLVTAGVVGFCRCGRN